MAKAEDFDGRAGGVNGGVGFLFRLASIMGPSYNASINMETVTLSPKYQVVIPRAIREAMHLTAGEKLWALQYGDRAEFIRVRPIQQMRGFLRGMETTIEREDDRL